MSDILSTIHSPQDLKELDKGRLAELCTEIRGRLIETVSKNGGHLASNLGVVELTVALHHTFDMPQDDILFDVGHQCYTHKLLTGRADKFHTLRKKGGISGFPKPSESEYDIFIAGHASGALSQAIGLCRAKQFAYDNSKVIAVVGDGSFGGGMVYEAINNIDHSLKNLIVILNDNEMSISKTVGAVPKYLLWLRTNYRYSRFKKSVQRTLQKLPLIGAGISRLLLQSKSSLRRKLFGGILFEELGFNYIGAVDGHDIDQLCRILGNVRNLDGPILVHVLTTKGKGFAKAEENPGAYHGVGKFDIDEGNPDIAQADSYSNAFGRKLASLSTGNTRICAVTAAMKYATGLNFFAKACRERFFDVGIAEEHAVAFAAGLALGGRKPVAAIYSTFLQRGFDQIMIDVAQQRQHVVFAVDRAGLVGEDGPTHHGCFDLSYLRTIPNMRILAPAYADDMRDALHTALSIKSGPAAIRYPRANAPDAASGSEPQLLEPGKARLVRDGKDVALLAIGRFVPVAMEAAEQLAANGIEASVYNMLWVKPLDEEAVQQALACRLVLTLEDGTVDGGFGSAVLEAIAKHPEWPDAAARKVQLLGLPDSFIPHGPAEELFAQLGLDAGSISTMIEEQLKVES